MTNQEIKELAGHREVPPWVMKLVADAVAMEREAVLETVYGYARSLLSNDDFQADIRARGKA